jgi:creatinine amidohydrolase
VRKLIGDGNYGGFYQKSEEETARLWDVAVRETRAQMEGDWV